MRFKLVFAFVAGVALLFSPAKASEVAAYEQERARVLAIDIDQRYQAVTGGMAFDTQTVLGKYFYNTVVAKTPGELSQFSLSQHDLRQLRESYPKYYLEHQILNSRMVQLTAAQVEENLTSLAKVAIEHQWMRLYRLVMAEKVAALQARGLTYKAIYTVQQLIEKADNIDVNTAYDYSLTRIYADLAALYRQGGNTTRSQYYCEKLQQTLSLANAESFSGELCESETLRASGKPTRALKIASDVLTQARNQESGTAMMTASLVIAQSYLQMGNHALAKRFAQEGLGVASHFPTMQDTARFKLLWLLARLESDAGNTDKARYYLAQLKAILVTKNAVYPMSELRVIEGDIARSERNFELAAMLYRKTLAEQYNNRQQELSNIVVANIDESLSSKEAAYVETHAKQKDAHSRNMTVLALFTTAISIVCAVAVYRLYRHKVMIESFTRVDQLTSVDNRWFALKAIRQYLSYMDRSDDKACVAILDIDHFNQINSRFGHEIGDKVLAHLAKVCKYQLRREDLIGRYGGEEFILLLVGTNLADAVEKIEALRDAVDSQAMTELEDTPLKFSCGLVEVTDSVPPDDVIALCSTLLNTAKQRGRNKTCYSTFKSPEQAQCT